MCNHKCINIEIIKIECIQTLLRYVANALHSSFVLTPMNPEYSASELAFLVSSSGREQYDEFHAGLN